MVENHVVYVVVLGSEVVPQYPLPQCISCHLVPAGCVCSSGWEARGQGLGERENSPPVGMICIGENALNYVGICITYDNACHMSPVDTYPHDGLPPNKSGALCFTFEETKGPVFHRSTLHVLQLAELLSEFLQKYHKAPCSCRCQIVLGYIDVSRSTRLQRTSRPNCFGSALSGSLPMKSR